MCHTAGIDVFDHGVFNMARNEAAIIDPQQRLLLEETLISWSAAANAGVAPNTSSSFTGVFGGCMYNEYTDVIIAGSGKLPPQAVVGSGLPYLVGRISYTFGFTGKINCKCLLVLVVLAVAGMGNAVTHKHCV